MKIIDFENSDFWKPLRPPLIQFSKLNNFLWVCWFLGKNLSNSIPPVWKLHNPYCHTIYWLQVKKDQTPSIIMHLFFVIYPKTTILTSISIVIPKKAIWHLVILQNGVLVSFLWWQGMRENILYIFRALSFSRWQIIILKKVKLDRVFRQVNNRQLCIIDSSLLFSYLDFST